jgi:AcrR family transcriptional regulator
MEAATASHAGGVPAIETDRATRIVEAMRLSVAARGFSGSTFDHVAREAGVSRGLLHYYFGTKERLLLEAVRRECDVRRARVEAAVSAATDAEGVLAALVTSFEDFLGAGPSRPVMFFEVLTLAQRTPEIAAELAALGRRMRLHLAEVLRAKARSGVLPGSDDPETTAAMLFVLADGLVVRRLSEPELDIAPIVDRAVAAARALLR